MVACELSFKSPLVLGLFPPRDSYSFLIYLVLCPENLAWLSAHQGTHVGSSYVCRQLNCYIGDPQNMAGQKCGSPATRGIVEVFL